jgi:hypothetical protein
VAARPQSHEWRCPGVFREIETQACPSCAEEVEFFPQDLELSCLGCGAEVKRRSSSCLSHCPAKQSDCYRELSRNGTVVPDRSEKR